MPTVGTLGGAVLPVAVVGVGVSLGREGAPRQAGAVIADIVSNRARLSDDERRLLVAGDAGAGMPAAFGVPLGGARFALEVLRGVLSLRMVLTALLTALIATAVSWLVLPDAPTSVIPAYLNSTSASLRALLAGLLPGLVSVIYVWMIACADRNKPTGWRRLLAPIPALGLLGAISIPFPQLLGNGKDVSELAFLGQVAPGLRLPLVFSKPLATVMCLGSGTPGGLFTPSLTLGALRGGLLGHAWSGFWPGIPPGLFAVIGAAAVRAATT